MNIIVHSAITMGLQVIPVRIEAALGSGFSGLQFLGLPQDYARDAKERIRASLESLGLTLPARKLLVSVRPSDSLKQFKAGLEHLDLPCAIAVLSALGEQQSTQRTNAARLRLLSTQLKQRHHFFAGQLTLTGEILPLENTLAFEILALQPSHRSSIFWCKTQKHKVSTTFQKTTLETSAPQSFCDVGSLQQCLSGLLKQESIHSSTSAAMLNSHQPQPETLNTDNAQQSSQRREKILNTLGKFEQSPSLALALCICAVGRHPILLAGSPGCGKTFALRNLRHLLPPLSAREKIEVALIQNRERADIHERPYRTPHHSASSAALLGGCLLQPGEVSLAHHGALFLDEFAEFPRPTLEALREPLDEKKISLARARGRVELPAHFLLLAATNPCACGYVFSRTIQCRCQVGAPLKYQQKLSGPLLERFSILLLVDHLTHHTEAHEPESSAQSYSVLRKVSTQWFKTVRDHPAAWAALFTKVQDSLWREQEHHPLCQEQQHWVWERANRQHWSTRKRIRISELLQTIQALFSGEFALHLNFDELLTLVEELRTLEGTLQKGVHLLTPGLSPFLLKKPTQRHDNPSE